MSALIIAVLRTVLKRRLTTIFLYGCFPFLAYAGVTGTNVHNEIYLRPDCEVQGNGTRSNCAKRGGERGAYRTSDVAIQALSKVKSDTDSATLVIVGRVEKALQINARRLQVSTLIIRGDESEMAGAIDAKNVDTVALSVSGNTEAQIIVRDLTISKTGPKFNCARFEKLGSLTIERVLFNGCGNSGVAISGTITNFAHLRSIECHDIGADINEAVGCVSVTPKKGDTVNNLIVEKIVHHGNGKSRYGVNLYPPTTGNKTGRVIHPVIRDIRCSGELLLACVNVQNDVPNAVIERVDTTGATAPSMVHVGGQGRVGDCPVETRDTILRDSILSGGLTNQFQRSDGHGVLFDECSSGWRAYRLILHSNQIAGMALNDTSMGYAESIIAYRNGVNALKLHGRSDGNVFNHFTLDGRGADASVKSDQGNDVVQVNATAGISQPNKLLNSIVIGDRSKCIDNDSKSSSFLVDKVIVHGCPEAVEGNTEGDVIRADPLLLGGKDAQGYRIRASSPASASGAKSEFTDSLDFNGDAWLEREDIGAFRRDACWKYDINLVKKPVESPAAQESACDPAR